ncbi:IS1016 transposase [Neisseria gonorrhoeae]|nr:IS1016 transposase [Neisseria gonorrhoeae]
MKITHCKLKKEVQKEPLRSFVPEVTARSAADILGIHPDSAALFYRKTARLPTIVWPWLPMRFSRAPPGRAEAVSAYGVKADAVAARQEKRLSSAFRNATGGPIPLPRTMPSLKRYPLPSKRKSCRTVLFMPIARAAAASWTRAVLPVAASTVPRNLQTVGTTLTALGTFGIRQNAPCENTTESIVNLSRRC